MCVVSNIGDQWARGWPQRYPQPITQPSSVYTYVTGISREEFDALKAEVENLKKLLKLGKAIDEASGTPDCEMDDKVALIRAVAEAVGVDLDEVFG